MTSLYVVTDIKGVTVGPERWFQTEPLARAHLLSNKCLGYDHSDRAPRTMHIVDVDGGRAHMLRRHHDTTRIGGKIVTTAVKRDGVITFDPPFRDQHAC